MDLKLFRNADIEIEKCKDNLWKLRLARTIFNYSPGSSMLLDDENKRSREFRGKARDLIRLIKEHENAKQLSKRYDPKDVRCTGSAAVFEALATDVVPEDHQLAHVSAISKDILRNNTSCHTVVSRLGCHISVFRNLKLAEPIPSFEEDPVLLGSEIGRQWYRHQNGFLLRWGSKEHPQTALPCVGSFLTWPEYRLLFLKWLLADLVLLKGRLT